MITLIETKNLKSQPTAEGSLTRVIDPGADKTRVEVSTYQVNAGQTHAVPPSDRSRVVYILEGKDAQIIYKGATHTSQRRSGVYLEPNEEASVKAAGGPLTLLYVSVPKHTGKAVDKEVA